MYEHQSADCNIIKIPARCEIEGVRQAEKCYRRGVIEQTARQKHAQDDVCGAFVHVGGGVVAAFLSDPAAKGVFRLRFHAALWVDEDTCVVFVRHLTHEYVVVARRDGVMRGKTFVFVEKLASVRQIPAYTHVWSFCQCHREILDGGVQCVEAYQLVQQAFTHEIWAISEHYLGAFFVCAYHAFYPLVVFRKAIGVSQ